MAVDVDGELPLSGDSAAAASSGASAGMFHVRHGKQKYHIRVPQGLHNATFKDLTDYLSAVHFVGVPVAQFRFVVKGKTPELADVLGPSTSSEASAMLLFREGFHATQEGAVWLKERDAELVEAEAMIEKLAKRVEANFVSSDTAIEIAEARALVETMEQSVESVQVRET